MSRTALYQAATVAAHKPCALPHHEKGSRVMWSEWDEAAGKIRRRRGIVLAHAARVLVIKADGGGQIATSCGHVVRGK